MTTTTIKNHVCSGHPVILVETDDEQQILRDAASIKSHTVATFSATQELHHPKSETIEEMNYTGAFHWLAAQPEAAEKGIVLVIFDAHHFLEAANMYRALLDVSDSLKSNRCSIVLVAPSWNERPVELLHAAPILSFEMPTREALTAVLQSVAADQIIELNGNTEALVDAAAGMTCEEAENAFSLSLVETQGELEPTIVAREKMRLIQGTGFMQFTETISPSQIGGLSQLKDYLAAETKWRADPHLRIRGLLFVGPPGTGKTLTAYTTGAYFQRPVISLSLSECKGSHVGDSEKNTRTALRLAEAVSPCILHIDEADKALGGTSSSAETDGGTSLGMLGILLTWLQDHKKQIIVVLTANDFDHVPSALVNRLDDTFFVDLPAEAERAAIGQIHLDRLSCQYDADALGTLATVTADWTGREIERLCRIAAKRGNRAPTAADIELAARDIIPLSKTKAEQMSKDREYLRNRLRPANDPTPAKKKGPRKITQTA